MNISQGEDLALAVQIIREGGIVAFPTETFYGLAVDPYNTIALQRLIAVKGRDAAKPILVLVQDIEQCHQLIKGVMPDSFLTLAKTFWPGPLTLICETVASLPVELTGLTGTLGMRQSSHPLAMQLLYKAGHPLTGTSANLSGQPAAETAEQVRTMFSDTVDYVLNGGQTKGKKASTLVKCTPDIVQCLREGAIDFNIILDALPQQNRACHNREGA
ncbi:MAG: threonylcarbamoyl-AMP synthase [Desulfobulbus propionicus]|nr:MAG: threonylcarbamoyl-AMP synthase [Desulfobulbus propionicus]